MLGKILSSLLLFIVISCGGWSVKKLYSDSFLASVKQSRALHLEGRKSEAFATLDALVDQKLNQNELTMKYNLYGYFYFSKQEYEEAIKRFQKALVFGSSDMPLVAQVNLNLSSTYFKLNQYQSAFVYITNVEHQYLNANEFKVFSKLYYLLAKQVDDAYQIVNSIILLERNTKTINNVRDGKYSSVLKDSFFKLSKSERMRFFESYEGKKNLAVAFLGVLEAKKRYFQGNKSEAKDIIDWLITNYAGNSDVLEKASSFRNRMDSFAKMNLDNIGVILPLTGKKAGFGEKALKGIDQAIASLKEKKVNIFLKDSKDSQIAAAMAVRELIEKHFVSFIIGGLFSDTAKEEYLEAKKYGVIFISLSPIYLPRDEKNHLLIEIPGSVESQVNAIFSDQFVASMGNKVALMYPLNEGGQSYLEEVWRVANVKNIQLTSIQSFDSNLSDFRDPVQKLLGLYYRRERKEEFDIWSEVYSLNKNSNIRRIQTLEPILDFDWVYIPAFPRDAINIVPSFGYYDAKGLKFVGGPSWRSAKLLKHYTSFQGKLYFTGSDSLDSRSFTDAFKERYKKNPKLLESRAFNATNLGLGLIDQPYASREELEASLSAKKTLRSSIGEWNLIEGIWLKKMDALTFFRRKIVKANLESNQSQEN